MSIKHIPKAIINYTVDTSKHYDRDIDDTRRSKEKFRAGVCANCKFIEDSKMFIKKLNENKYPSIKGKSCSKCGCILSLKIRSNDKCPMGYWK